MLRILCGLLPLCSRRVLLCMQFTLEYFLSASNILYVFFFSVIRWPECTHSPLTRTTADDSLRTIPLATTATAAKLLRNAFASNDQEVSWLGKRSEIIDCALYSML